MVLYPMTVVIQQLQDGSVDISITGDSLILVGSRHPASELLRCVLQCTLDITDALVAQAVLLDELH